jgi:hypothetical protein
VALVGGVRSSSAPRKGHWVGLAEHTTLEGEIKKLRDKVADSGRILKENLQGSKSLVRQTQKLATCMCSICTRPDPEARLTCVDVEVDCSKGAAKGPDTVFVKCVRCLPLPCFCLSCAGFFFEVVREWYYFEFPRCLSLAHICMRVF